VPGVRHETLDRHDGAEPDGEDRRGRPDGAPGPHSEVAAETTDDLADDPHGTDEDLTGDDRPWRRAFTTALSIWGAASLAYFLVNAMVWMMRSEAGPRLGDVLDVWDQWDTGHYVTIALQGYNPNTENPAFFPLYPLLIRYLEPVLPGGALSAGLIISHAACLGALTILFRLTEDLLGTAMAKRTTFYLMAFPFAWFLVTAYNEAVFLLFMVASLYCMRRGSWWSAGLWGALASATRQAGVLLALAFALEYLRQRNWRPLAIRADALAVLLVPTGVAAFAYYSWRAFGDPLKFVHVQAAWGRKPSLPWEGTARAIDVITKASVDGAIFQPIVVLNVIDVMAVGISLILLVLSVVGPWRLGQESLYLIVSAFASFLLILVSPIGLDVPLHGLPRYVLELLPAFMVLARMGANQHVERFYLMPAIAVQGVLVLGFYFDYWLA
jgi:Gpi18-like mannosyltransferase